VRRRDEYGQLTGLCSPWLEHLRLRQVVRHIPQGSSILEVGCGRAGILRYHHHPRYVGLDIIPEVIEGDRSRYPQYEFYLLNAEEENMASLSWAWAAHTGPPFLGHHGDRVPKDLYCLLPVGPVDSGTERRGTWVRIG
jgi:SAM-dependent methyltransferase